MSKFFFILQFLIPITLFGQMLESTSRPYHFEIDHTEMYENISNTEEYDISPYKSKIRDKMEIVITKLYDSEGIKLANSSEFESIYAGKSHEIFLDVAQEVGLDAMTKSKSTCLFIAEKLQFEISFTDFKPFSIGIPLADVEPFQENFQQLVFSDQKILFNDQNEFVITHLEIFNPVNAKKYIFYNTEDETVIAPSFNIHLPTYSE